MPLRIRQKLSNGQTTIGTWLQLPSSDVAEIMGKAGYDWVAVDLEHGLFSNHKLPDVFRAIECGGAVPMVRLAHCHPKDIKHALDAGAKGLIFPMIEDAQQLENAISWAHYPPRGARGVGYSRANLYGKNFDDYIHNRSGEILIVAMIEHMNAVTNLDDILKVVGLDSIMVGPYDLSGSMNLTGQFDHPVFLDTMDEIFQKTKVNNVPMGLHIVQPDQQLLNNKIQAGYQFIAYGIDAVFLYNSATKPEIGE